MTSITPNVKEVKKIHIHLTLTPQEAEWLLCNLGTGGLYADDGDENSNPPWAALLFRVEAQLERALARQREGE